MLNGESVNSGSLLCATSRRAFCGVGSPESFFYRLHRGGLHAGVYARDLPPDLATTPQPADTRNRLTKAQRSRSAGGRADHHRQRRAQTCFS